MALANLPQSGLKRCRWGTKEPRLGESTITLALRHEWGHRKRCGGHKSRLGDGGRLGSTSLAVGPCKSAERDILRVSSNRAVRLVVCGHCEDESGDDIDCKFKFLVRIHGADYLSQMHSGIETPHNLEEEVFELTVGRRFRRVVEPQLQKAVDQLARHIPIFERLGVVRQLHTQICCSPGEIMAAVEYRVKELGIGDCTFELRSVSQQGWHRAPRLLQGRISESEVSGAEGSRRYQQMIGNVVDLDGPKIVRR
mmetsp:Transcript_3520/g.10850  ORF Transcript_3520/g.10850 Transcript_3520/m.10850 type:complete len:253 (+) Transcript_3520:112-870(+)